MKVEIDIHGLTEQMAIKTLEKFIVSCDKSISEIVVIHGYHGGNALKDMVRNPNKLRSKKIRKRKLSLNQGETILQLY
ncbi:MAG: Endonuclease MutS2 [Candidatus Izimaplasma bacterium HR2]|nr:MAG: Endonuclease MutS2 [Candidatus Izimaplasma bacterium HR2]